MPEVTPAILAAADQVEHDLGTLDVSTRALLTLLRAGDTQPPSGGSDGFIGAASAAATSVALPAHEAGDLILVFASHGASSTIPTLPAGFTDISSLGSNFNSYRLGYKIAASSGETSGTWTNAAQVIAHVYRGFDQTEPIGATVNRSASGTTLTYLALSMEVSDGSSWVAGFAVHRNTDGTLETPPSGMTNRSDVTGSGQAAGHDTAGGVAEWASTNVGIGGTSGFHKTVVVELLAA